MKRIISIFLLMIMLLIGSHPVLAVHFCAGNLLSVNLINTTSQSHSCCVGMDEMSEEDCEGGSQSHNDGSLVFTGAERDCCSFTDVALSTDDFNYQMQQFNLNHLLLLTGNICLPLNYISTYIAPDSLFTVQHIFPPGGLGKLNIDLLTYICIYRI